MSETRAGTKIGGRRLPDPKQCQELAEQMLALSLKAGADGAEVLVRDGTELEVKVRLGEPELIKEAGSRALGLRVIKDQRAAVTVSRGGVTFNNMRDAFEGARRLRLGPRQPRFEAFEHGIEWAQGTRLVRSGSSTP